ncbi:MAG: hypothetical protein ACR2F2_13025 [Pyrinomonadaceae bacterium]
MNKRLLVKKQGKIIPALTLIIPPSGIVSVGSDASANIELEGETVAPEQFVIVCEGNLLTLLCRVQNTRINGTVLEKGALHNLELHDEIVVGDYSLVLETGEAAEKILAGDTEEISAAPEKIEPPLIEKSEAEKENSHSQKNVEKTAFVPDESLSDVLEGLKAEEKFYFLIENGSQEKRRIYIETEEMWLGWAATGECVISGDPADIAIPRAQIRKDWSGVVLYPVKTKNIWLNKQVLEQPHRLKNDDLLQLLSKERALPDAKTNIKFHEPTALLVLDAILPKELPPPVSLDKTKKSPEAIHETQNAEKIAPAKIQNADNAKVFGYFTGFEIFIMIVGILVAAALIFLVLEYF